MGTINGSGLWFIIRDFDLDFFRHGVYQYQFQHASHQYHILTSIASKYHSGKEHE